MTGNLEREKFVQSDHYGLFPFSRWIDLDSIKQIKVAPIKILQAHKTVSSFLRIVDYLIPVKQIKTSFYLLTPMGLLLFAARSKGKYQ
jgi:hypothetical protein